MNTQPDKKPDPVCRGMELISTSTIDTQFGQATVEVYEDVYKVTLDKQLVSTAVGALRRDTSVSSVVCSCGVGNERVIYAYLDDHTTNETTEMIISALQQ